MRNLIQPGLRLVCLLLVAGLAYQIAQTVLRGNPAGHLTIPQLPKLASDTNSPAEKPADAKGTNSTAKAGTNSPATNAVAEATPAKGTNSAAANDGGKKDTNFVALTKAPKETNSLAANQPETKETNVAAGGVTNAAGTNLVSHREIKNAGTNLVAGTNNIASSNSVATATNAGSRARSPGRRPGGPGGPGGMPPGMGMPGGGPPLPGPISARISRIVDSEIMGMIMHPVPMGLIGIAGNSAMLRAPNGQTGLVKEGDELGGIKLLRIGTNRVLVEEAGESKELTLYSGLGGDSLLPTQKGNSNETNH